MGTSHTKNLVAGKVPGVELTAVCDINPKRLDVAKNEYGIENLFDDAIKMYESGLIDAVLIAVPHYDHPTLAIEAFKHNLHVMCEKPAGVYTKQVLEMNEAAKKSDRVFGIMYNQRTNPLYQKVREMIQSGMLGQIKRVNWTITNWYRPQIYHDSAEWRSTWKDEGGGTLINQNPHQLDLWQWMFGMPSRIMSHCYFGKYYDIETEDDVTAFMEYDNGMTGVYITSTAEAPGTNRLEIACDMGKIVVEDEKMIFFRNVESEREFNKKNTSPFGGVEFWKCEIPVSGSGEQHTGIFKDFTKVLSEGGKLLAPGEEGILGLTISNAIHYSAWTGKTVDVKNFDDEGFYNILQEKIKNSTVDKSNIEQKVSDTTGTY